MPAETTTPRLTAAMLKAVGACAEQRKLFAREWPKGAEVTEASVLRAVEMGLDVDWLVSKALPDAASAEYRRVTAPASAEYRRVTDTAWAEYERVKDAASAEYGRVRDAAAAEYGRVRDAAAAEYGRVRAAELVAVIRRFGWKGGAE